MGFNDINLQVSGPQQPASIYKTKVLKGQVPFATQVTEPNTKYVIKHNFVLNGDVTIPENCILEFDGGSINGNSTINFNSCQVCGLPNILCLYNGDIKNTILNVTWFGCDSLGNEDCSAKLKRLFDTYSDYYGKQIYFPKGTYLIANQISMPRNVFIKGDGVDSVLKLTYEGFAFLFEHDVNRTNDFLNIEISDIHVIGTYPSWYDANPDYTECSFLKNDIYTYPNRCVIQNCKIERVKVGLHIEQAYWTRLDRVYFYDYYDALTLTEANSSAITNCGFRGGRNTGILFKQLRDRGSAGVGVAITGNDFSGNNHAGLCILSELGWATITGNYFECEPGVQIIVGDPNDAAINAISKLNYSTIIGNAGFWAEPTQKKGITIYGTFNSNNIDCCTFFKDGSIGSNNRGLLQNGLDMKHFISAVYEQKEVFLGVKKWYDSKIKQEHYRDVIIPPNTDILLDIVPGQYFKLLFFDASNDTVRIKCKVDNTEYIIGSAEAGQNQNVDEKAFWDGLFTDFGSAKNVFIYVCTTNNACVIADIRIKMFYNLYVIN